MGTSLSPLWLAARLSAAAAAHVAVDPIVQTLTHTCAVKHASTHTHTTHKNVNYKEMLNTQRHTHADRRKIHRSELSDVLILQIKAMSAGLKSTFYFS